MEAKAPDWVSGTIYAAACPTWVSNCQKPIQTSGCGKKVCKDGDTLYHEYVLIYCDNFLVISNRAESVIRH